MGVAKDRSREQEVSAISRGLKTLAKEFAVPVIALSQLNREFVHRADRRPQLHDLRDSGAIEQDADVVLMLHRDDINGGSGENAGLALVIVRKNRNGPLGDVTLRFNAPFCRFESTEERFMVNGARSTIRDYRPSGVEDLKKRAAGDDA